LKTPKAELQGENLTFRSPLWRSVFALVGLLILSLLTLYFNWLLHLSYTCQMNKETIYMMVLVIL